METSNAPPSRVPRTQIRRFFLVKPSLKTQMTYWVLLTVAGVFFACVLLIIAWILIANNDPQSWGIKSDKMVMKNETMKQTGLAYMHKSSSVRHAENIHISYSSLEPPLFTFFAFGTVFELVLKPHASLIHPDSPLNKDHKYYEGHIASKPGITRVSGRFHKLGFIGVIHNRIEDESYFLELDKTSTRILIYKLKDVDFSDNGCRRHSDSGD